MVVEGKVGVGIGKWGVVEPKYFFLDDNGFWLEFNGLETVPELKLNICHLTDTLSDLMEHSSWDRE